MNTNRTRSLSALLLIATAALGGCASTYQQPSGSYQQQQSNQVYEQQRQPVYQQPARQSHGSYGAIDSIQVIRGNNGGGSSGAGAVVGGLAGGLLGNQVGGGSGRTAATVLGALGGALVGNNVEQNRTAPAPDSYRIHVRLDNGDGVTVVQDNLEGLRMGSRVRVANGRAYND
ncbi:glycine zipper 2TM domain-containing protein [Janthinobacterium sp.]|uniref:glycine zipper 2TM domain-containing protein n=1 Tax=Janthinobacterium sp. TaxID=1871054 RepID=UPI00293D20E0|nr:glycine zipper 2TM domain-containing protein [Janthinobacterium sp.]